MNQERLRTSDLYLLLSLIVIAAVIRFFDYQNLPYMHDELSAIIRAQAGGMSELITKAETTDVHPVGIHLFLHFWTSWFGQSEMLVKLPFILMGLASLWFSFRIAERWFGATTALLTVAFMASLQFSTMYGQLARPYASGIFFCSWMVWCWTEYLMGNGRRLGGFMLAATLCCYNHYFSMLFAGIVGISGIFFLKRKNLISYLLACLGVLLLFFPHVSVTLTQIAASQEANTWWIAKPEWTWLSGFLKYLFHYSAAVYVMVFLLLVLSLTFYRNEQSVFYRMRILCAVLAFLPFTVIYLYSRNNSPLLQFSSMTFSLPFLLMLLFSFFKDLDFYLRSLLLIVVVLVNTFTLFGERKHHHVFYKQAYEQMALMSLEAEKQFGSGKVASAHAIAEGFMDHYYLKHGPFGFLRVDTPDPRGFREYVAKQQGDYFVAGNLPGEYLSVLREKYPYKIKSVESFTCWLYCFAKDSAGKLPGNNIVFEEVMNDTLIAKGNEFGPSISRALPEISNSRYNDIHVIAEVETKSKEADPTLVLAMNKGGQQIAWLGSDYISYRNADGTASIYLSLPLRDFAAARSDSTTCSVYIWNKTKTELKIKKLKLFTEESNPYVYGLYEPF